MRKAASPFWSIVADTGPSGTSAADPWGKQAETASTADAADSLARAIEFRDGKPYRLEGIEIFEWQTSGPGRAPVTSDHLRCVKLAKILGVRPIFLTLANNISIEWPNVKQASISCRADGNSVEFDLNSPAEIPDAIVGLSTLAHGMFGVSARKNAVAATRCFQLQSARNDNTEPDYDFVKVSGDAYVSCRATAGDTKLNVRSARSWIVRAHLERERRKRAEKDVKKVE